MQTLWEGKCEWDQPLPAKWYDLARDLQQAVLIEIPRYYFKEESPQEQNFMYSQMQARVHTVRVPTL